MRETRASLDSRDSVRGKSIALTLLVAVLIVAGAACSPAPPTPTRTVSTPVATQAATPSPVASPTPDAAMASLTRSDTRNGVSLSIAWLTTDYLRANPNATMGADPSRFIIFKVDADTPTLQLSVWDLRGMIYLRDDGSGMEFGSPTWLPASDGSHKTAVAAFPNKDSRGNPVPSTAARSLQIVVRDMGGVPERVFSWPVAR